MALFLVVDSLIFFLPIDRRDDASMTEPHIIDSDWLEKVRTYRRAAVVLALSNACVCTVVALLRAYGEQQRCVTGARRDASATPTAASRAPPTSAASATLDEVTATAGLFLASKLEEEPRGIRDVFNAMRLARDPSAPLVALDSAYWEMKELVVEQEQQILRSVAFDVNAIIARAQPNRWVYAFGRALCVPLKGPCVAAWGCRSLTAHARAWRRAAAVAAAHTKRTTVAIHARESMHSLACAPRTAAPLRIQCSTLRLPSPMTLSP